MKKFILLSLISVLSFSCKDREDNGTANTDYVGTWNWMNTNGGVSNVNQTPENTGKTVKITFTADDKYTVTENNKVVNEGTYKLYKDITSTDHMERTFINFSNYPVKVVRNITATNLYLYDDAPDGFSYHYVKE